MRFLSQAGIETIGSNKKMSNKGFEQMGKQYHWPPKRSPFAMRLLSQAGIETIGSNKKMSNKGFDQMGNNGTGPPKRSPFARALPQRFLLKELWSLVLLKATS